MAIKKSEMYTSLYESCDKLRGGMDPSLYKNYILTLLFVKYISDKYAGMKYAPIKIPRDAVLRTSSSSATRRTSARRSTRRSRGSRTTRRTDSSPACSATCTSTTSRSSARATRW